MSRPMTTGAVPAAQIQFANHRGQRPCEQAKNQFTERNNNQGSSKKALCKNCRHAWCFGEWQLRAAKVNRSGSPVLR